MEKRPCVSMGQVFGMLFVSRMVVSMTYGTLLIGDSEIWDHLLSAPAAFLLTFLLILPCCKLFSMDKKMNVTDNIKELCGKFSTFLILLYVAYYIIICLHTLAVFDNFIVSAVNPPISVPLLSVLLLISCCYGAYKGLEALARTSNFILVSTIFSIIFLSVSLFSSIEKINFKPLAYSGYESAAEGIFYMISQSSCVPALAVLLPMAKGNFKKCALLWNAGVYCVFALIIIVIVGTMGDFAQTQLFPVYTAAGIGKFGSLRHLDSIYLGVWISGIFLKLSLFLLLAGEGVKKLFGEKVRKISILIFGFIMMLAGFFPEKLKMLRETSITSFLLVFLLIISVMIPAALIFLRKFKNRGERVKIEI